MAFGSLKTSPYLKMPKLFWNGGGNKFGHIHSIVCMYSLAYNHIQPSTSKNSESQFLRKFKYVKTTMNCHKKLLLTTVFGKNLLLKKKENDVVYCTLNLY